MLAEPMQKTGTGGTASEAAAIFCSDGELPAAGNLHIGS